jgi:hypothetical protein
LWPSLCMDLLVVVTPYTYLLGVLPPHTNLLSM